MAINKTIMMGRLTKSPELQTKGNSKYLYGTVAVDRSYKAKDEEKPRTDFFDFKASGHTAEFIAQYFDKGSLVFFEGSFEVTESKYYTSEKGNPAPAVYLNVIKVDFTGERRNSNAETKEKPTVKYGQTAPAKTESSQFNIGDFEEFDDEDDGLPF